MIKRQKWCTWTWGTYAWMYDRTSECVVCVFWGFNNTSPIHCFLNCSVFISFFLLFLSRSFKFILFLFLKMFYFLWFLFSYCLLIYDARGVYLKTNNKAKCWRRYTLHSCTNSIRHSLIPWTLHTINIQLRIY